MSGVTPRRFAFERHPPHLDIAVAAGAYAGKPIIVSDVARERPGLVLWLDARDLVFGDLRSTWRTIERQGVLSPGARAQGHRASSRVIGPRDHRLMSPGRTIADDAPDVEPVPSTDVDHHVGD